jgi:hypothetical protein
MGHLRIDFHRDGVLDIIANQAKGRAEIRKKLEEARPVFDQAFRAQGQGKISSDRTP